MPWSVVLGLSAAYAVFVVAAIRSELGRFFSFAIPLAHVIALYLDNPNQRVVSFHGFFQYSIVYEILNGHLPPENSLLAGEPLFYPWAEHVVLAAIALALRVSPALACALLNVVCLVAALYLLSRIARDLGFDAPRSTAFVLLPLLGVVFAAFNASTSIAAPYVPLRLEWRGAPLIGHFNVPTGGTLGVVFFLMHLRALLRTVSGASASWTIFAAALGVGIFYPPMFPGVLASFVMLLVVTMARSTAHRSTELVAPLAAMLAATAIGMPYMVLITSGMQGEVRPGFHHEIAPLLGAAAQVLLAVLPAALIVWLLRRQWREAFGDHREAVVLLLAVLVGLAAGYTVTHYQGWGEYKLAILMNLVAAMIAAPAIAALSLSLPAVAIVVLSLFFIPVGVEVQGMYSAWHRVDHPWVEEGAQILPVAPGSRELYGWIRANTGSSDAFIDSQLTLPTFAGRRLWVGLDPRSFTGNRMWKDGWLMSPRELVVDLFGADPRLFDCRTQLARAIFAPDADIDASLRALAGAAPENGLWIVARKRDLRVRLATAAAATPAFANSVATVFRLARDPTVPDECRAPV